MGKYSRIGHPSVKALLALKEGPRKHEKDANDAIFKISKLVVKETSEKAMFDGSLILRKGGKKVNEMNDVERIRAVAAILCCVPVEVKERILLYFNVHTVVEGEHVLTKRNYYALSLSLSLSLTAERRRKRTTILSPRRFRFLLLLLD